MIPFMKWPDHRRDEPFSPFLRGKGERAIKITFHSSSFIGATAEETEAIDLLREFSFLSEVEAIDTQTGQLPYLEIGEYDGKAALIPITVTDKDQQSRDDLEFYDDLLSISARISNQCDLGSPETLTALGEILLVKAAERLRSDILVSLSPRLLGHRTKSALQRANVRSPLEAAKIVGLFLRSRGNYTWQVTPTVRRHFDSGGFYNVLARHKLPNMWHYSSVCESMRAVRPDDTSQLCRSLLMRCAWALEARDAVGKRFYGLHNNTTRDVMMYHFNYLTLLLVGAFDAQARIAYRAYGITKPKERNASFRNLDFLNVLKSNGATSLYSLTSNQNFLDLTTLLHKLRNTIHGSVFPMMFSDQESFVIVMTEYQKELWEAAKRLGPPERWGLVQDSYLRFEPYTYAATLVEECFSLIDKIAIETDVMRLFPAGHPIPALQNHAPNDGVFDEPIRRRLAILG